MGRRPTRSRCWAGVCVCEAGWWTAWPGDARHRFLVRAHFTARHRRTIITTRGVMSVHRGPQRLLVWGWLMHHEQEPHAWSIDLPTTGGSRAGTGWAEQRP